MEDANRVTKPSNPKTYADATASMLQTPKIKRATFRVQDISLDSETFSPFTVPLTPQQLLDMLNSKSPEEPTVNGSPDTAPISPLYTATRIPNYNLLSQTSPPAERNITRPLETSPPRDTNTSGTQPVRPPALKQRPTHAIWLTLCLSTVAAVFPRDKAKAIGDAFVKFVGAEQAKPFKEIRSGLLFKIRKDALPKARQFSFGTFDFKLTEKPKYGKGIIQIPKHANVEQLKNELKAKPNVEAVHSGTKNSFLTVTFNTENTPTNIIGLNVKPALLATLRCFKCQMFGHASNICKNNAKCPHCAGNHAHASCKTKNVKKCANCDGKHSAAYKGCPEYLKYQTLINNKNLRVTNQYIHNIEVRNKRTNLEQLAKQLVGKSEAEILTILQNKFPDNEAEHQATTTTTNPKQPVHPKPADQNITLDNNNTQSTNRQQQSSQPPNKTASLAPPKQQQQQRQPPRSQEQRTTKQQQHKHRSHEKPARSTQHIPRNRPRIGRYCSTPIKHPRYSNRFSLAPPFPACFRNAYGFY